MNEVELKEKMVKVLTHLVDFLADSEPSAYASKLPSDLSKVVSSNLESMKSSGYLSSPEEMNNMFLPTASLQEIAMDNGWGNQYLELASHFEMALGVCH